MSVTQVNPLLVRKIITLSALRDTGFERAFDSVTAQIVGTVEVTQVQEGFGLFQPDLRPGSLCGSPYNRSSARLASNLSDNLTDLPAR